MSFYLVSVSFFPDSALGYVQLLLGAVSLLASVVGGLWAYAKYIVERGLLPPVRFDVTCRRLGGVEGQKGLAVFDVGVHLENLGTSTLVARNMRLDLRYLEAELPSIEEFQEEPDAVKERFLVGRGRAGRLSFPGSLVKRLDPDPADRVMPEKREGPLARFLSRLKGAEEEKEGAGEKAENKVEKKEGAKEEEDDTPRGFLMLEHDAFVQPGVDQRFSFVTALPVKASTVLVWSAFEYAQKPIRLQRPVLWLSRQLGLIQFTLAHISRPHTVERVFEVA